MLVGTALLSGSFRSSCAAQEAITKQGDELEPVASALTELSDIEDYHRKLRSLLLRKAPDRSNLQFLSMPSFEPESLLTVFADGTEYRGVTLRPDQSLWYDKRPAASVAIKEHKKAIPTEVAKRAMALWRTMLTRTRYQKHEGVDLDGIRYVFLISEERGRAREGETANPVEKTRGWWLANIGELSTKFVEAPANAEADLLKDLAKAMDALEALLKEPDQKEVRADTGK
jgi:hypothetical protein